MIVAFFIALPLILYVGVGAFLHVFAVMGANRLISLEEQGRLSREYGFVWQEINLNREMSSIASAISDTGSEKQISETESKREIVEFPSLSAITELNNIRDFSKVIRITDRNGIPLSEIRTTHTCIDVSEINDMLLKSLIITEDQRFYTRSRAYDYNALVRSFVDAVFRSISTRRIQMPRATSTIHMQVARFLMLRTNTLGYAYTDRSIMRKMREIQLAEALKSTFTDEEILTVYINHCVSAGRGMRGYYDISKGLFGIHPSELDTAQSLYLARLVKWNRHVPDRIIQQVKASLPELARHLDWDKESKKAIRRSVDSLSFRPFQPIISRNSHLIDLANEYWREICRQKGMSRSELEEMDIANPESMIRRFGNLTIALTLDYRLQKKLEELVDARGFGPDTLIRTDIRIGSKGTDMHLEEVPPDTVRKITLIEKDSLFRDPVSGASVQLNQNDTLITNIRYRKTGTGQVRRSAFFYRRGDLPVPGQYFAYAIMDSQNRQLLAYYSRDRLGSRLTSLLRNRTPNGSSLAKPIIFALTYDLGIYEHADMATDESEVADTIPWARTAILRNGDPVGMRYLKTTDEDGYMVHNHHRRFDGYDFIYNHLYRSNNILSVEAIYRLNTDLRDTDNPQTSGVSQLLKRIGSQSLMANRYVTGADLYKAIAGVVSEPVAAKYNTGRSPSQTYSVALGTLELSLFEQLHLFNVLYDNRIPVNPSRHPKLFIKDIMLAGKPFHFEDTLEYVNLFSSMESIKPVALALHKRLVSSPRDRLGNFDICDQVDMYGNQGGLLSNFAKSGTTDNIIRPFNVDNTSGATTNYGLWHAVLRLNLTRDDLVRMVKDDENIDSAMKKQISFDRVPAEEITDITIASVGECNYEYTGSRDGKSLHGYLTRELLHTFGIPCTDGFYADYENKLINSRSRDELFSYQQEETDLSFFSRTFIRLRTIGSEESVDEVSFDRNRSGNIVLRRSNYRTMLSFAQYMGSESRRYRDLVSQLRRPASIQAAEETLEEILAIDIENQFLRRELESAVKSLKESLR
ncbi:Multimodular transpeptidase-transglycosylase [Chitinispirillum alkaliphilum]|nr:Multimodular transpeptidase-transglycosylase [Chitinispirillum alkaliphilum]